MMNEELISSQSIVESKIGEVNSDDKILLNRQNDSIATTENAQTSTSIVASVMKKRKNNHGKVKNGRKKYRIIGLSKKKVKADKSIDENGIPLELYHIMFNSCIF